MARYMGGPRGRLSRRVPAPLIVSPTSSDRETDDSDQDQTNTNPPQNGDEVSDTDDPESSSQDDQGDVLQQRQLGLDSGMEGENGDGTAYGGDYDSESRTTAVSIVPAWPGREGGVLTESAYNDKEPRPKRQRSLSIPIHYNSRFSTGLPIYEPQPMSIAYGWMAKGTAEHIEDLHLSGIPPCSRLVHSKTKIEVLGEYTWIEVTPSQQESYERFPAIYVPGNARTWRGLKIDTSLDQDNLRSIAAQRIRDDNLNRQPQYPYEPTFRALESAESETSFRNIDIVSDADSLTQLLSFIMGPSSSRPVREPFRLELTTVRNTLFVQASRKPGSSQAGPPPKKARTDPAASVPDWAADALGRAGTRAARLPYSGGHYRLVRYRFGSVVLAVRVKVDFVYEHRKDSMRAQVDPLRGVQPEFLPRQGGDAAMVWRTAAKRQGLGTRPAGAGVGSVRYAWQDPKARMRALLPGLWFSRSPFVVDCQVESGQGLRVTEVALVNSRKWYPSYERGYQASLRRLAGLLRHLQERTREMGGNVVLIADPVQVCFVLLKPVIHRPALPEELVTRFWGPNTEEDEERERQAEMDRESTPEEEQSDLTDLSKTPSLPPGSDIAYVGRSSQLDQPQQFGGGDGASSHVAGGSPSHEGRQRDNDVDQGERVRNWTKSVGNTAMQSVGSTTIQSGGSTAIQSVGSTAMQPSEHVDAGYEAGDEADNSSTSRSDFQTGNMDYGAPAEEAGFEGAGILADIVALPPDTGGAAQQQEAGGDDFQMADVDDVQMAAVSRDRHTEVLQGQHSVLVADRHLTAGMHTSDDDGEWPPGPRTEVSGRITNAVQDAGEGSSAAAARSSPTGDDEGVVPPASTPLGPSDFDSEGNVIDRRMRKRGGGIEESSDEDSSDVVDMRHDLTASGRARLSEPNAGWRQRYRYLAQAESEEEDGSHETSSQGDQDDPKGENVEEDASEGAEEGVPEGVSEGAEEVSEWSPGSGVQEGAPESVVTGIVGGVEVDWHPDDNDEFGGGGAPYNRDTASGGTPRSDRTNDSGSQGGEYGLAHEF